jgi:hypothetical protein
LVLLLSTNIARLKNTRSSPEACLKGLLMNIASIALAPGAAVLLVACASAAAGLQQIGEPLSTPGADFVGPLSPGLHKMTVFAAVIAVNPKRPETAREVIRSLIIAAGPAIGGMGSANARAVM